MIQGIVQNTTTNPAVITKPVGLLPSRAGVVRLYSACSVPIHTWAVLMYFNQLPAYLLQLHWYELIAILGYALLFAFVDSLLAVGFLMLVHAALSRRFFPAGGVEILTLLFLITFIWLIPVHYQTAVLQALYWNMQSYVILVIGWVISYLCTLFGAIFLYRKYSRVKDAIASFLERLSPLSAFYFGIDCSLAIYILFRQFA